MQALFANCCLVELVITGVPSVTFPVHIYEPVVERTCRLLKMNKTTLSSIKIQRSRATQAFIDRVFRSLNLVVYRRPGVSNFLVTDSWFHDGFLNLASFKFIDSLVIKSSNVTWDALTPIIMNTSCRFTHLDLSYTTRFSSMHLEGEANFSYFRVLILTGNNLRPENFYGWENGLTKMTSLVELDMSENPIGDGGLSRLILCLQGAQKLCDLKIEHCNFSHEGLVELLQFVLESNHLKSLSIARSDLWEWSTEVATSLATFLAHSTIKTLNIEGIGLGDNGFAIFREELPLVVNLSFIDVSNNNGAAETTLFTEEFISKALGIVDIKASNNLIQEESLQHLKATLAGVGREFELLENDVQKLEIHFP
ncbi:protein NLRC5-like [Papaver somniferum]|uniref:protein NLRC5-like n=1 Tax=Papaver somniferum TaxID=3469 RepID=UPI000E6FC6B3|nr:protein NLRC5-like [Papaver somniferum]